MAHCLFTQLYGLNPYGWGVLELNGHKYVGHNGLINNGYSSTFLRFIEDNFVVIILMNVSNQDNIGLNLGQVLSSMALGEEYKLPEKRDERALSKDELNRFEGKYEFANGNLLTVKRLNDYLVLIPSEVKGIKYIPYSAEEFYAKGSEYRKIKFTLDKGGNVAGIILEECVFSLEGTKIE